MAAAHCVALDIRIKQLSIQSKFVTVLSIQGTGNIEKEIDVCEHFNIVKQVVSMRTIRKMQRKRIFNFKGAR